MKHGPVLIYIDNKSAIDMERNPVFHGRSKHIDVRYHFISERVEKGKIILRHVSSEGQRLDVLTKAMAKVKFERIRALLGVQDVQRKVKITGMCC